MPSPGTPRRSDACEVLEIVRNRSDEGLDIEMVGMLIRKVHEGGAAHRAGAREGMQVIAVSDTRVQSIREMARLVTSAGVRFTLKVSNSTRPGELTTEPYHRRGRKFLSQPNIDDSEAATLIQGNDLSQQWVRTRAYAEGPRDEMDQPPPPPISYSRTNRRSTEEMSFKHGRKYIPQDGFYSPTNKERNRYVHRPETSVTRDPIARYPSPPSAQMLDSLSWETPRASPAPTSRARSVGRFKPQTCTSPEMHSALTWGPSSDSDSGEAPQPRIYSPSPQRSYCYL